MIVDGIGQPLEVGDTIAHCRVQSSHRYFSKRTILAIDDEAQTLTMSPDTSAKWRSARPGKNVVPRNVVKLAQPQEERKK